MSFSSLLDENAPCFCGFALWLPIADSEHSRLGLYNDARFPGRSILTLKDHYESLEEVPMETMTGFIEDIQKTMTAIRTATGAARVNVAILGNRDPHVHAHLIPRFPSTEEFPDCSPWNDRRIKTALSEDCRTQVMADISEALH